MHDILLNAEVSFELMKLTHLPLQEEETVMPKSSPAQSEEEQLHPQSRRRKRGLEEQGEASPAHRQVSNNYFFLIDLLRSLHVNIPVFCAQVNSS